MNMTSEEILQYVAAYNEKIYPLQIIAYLLGILAVGMAIKKSILKSRITAGILALMWLWVAAVFALPYAIEGNFVGITTAIVFFIQGGLFVWQVFKPRLFFGTYTKAFTIIGILFILIAMIGYPVIGYFIGHIYPRTLSFGITPCPLTVFTLGIMMLTSKKVPIWLLVLPFLFSLTGFFPVLKGIYEDIFLIISGLVCGPLLYFRDRRQG